MPGKSLRLWHAHRGHHTWIHHSHHTGIHHTHHTGIHHTHHTGIHRRHSRHTGVHHHHLHLEQHLLLLELLRGEIGRRHVGRKRFEVGGGGRA